ncbi:MAG: DUF1566 domain-containing protein [Nitrospinaceae bacterium]
MSDEKKLNEQKLNEEKTEEKNPSHQEDEEEYAGEEWIGEEEWLEEDEEALAEEEVPTLVDNGNGTISDPRNNLMWKKSDSYGEFGYGINWFEAHDYCESLNEKNFAGYDDWRLASFEDAKTLFSFTKSNYDKDGAEIHIDSIFDSGQGHNTWTYDEKPDYQQYALKFSYVTGTDVWEHKDNEYSHVRVVRDEVKDEWEPEWRDKSKKFAR